MSRYKAYSEYRDSGVDWFDSLPTKWDVKRISYIAQLQSGDAIVSEQIEDEGSYAVYGGNGLRGYSSNFNLEGDYILIGRQGALCGNINYGSGKFWASEHAVVVYPFFDVDIKWLGETLRAMNLNQYNVSAAQPGLAVTNITCLKIPFPSRDEQEKIAKFLDHETAKIDVLIEKQQRLIELLKEKRQAVISHAVTKGLNPNAPMKDSGVEWLGNIPFDWECVRLKFASELSGGKVAPSNEERYVGLENVQSNSGKFIATEEVIPEGISNVFSRGDVLFGKLRPYLAKSWLADFSGICSSEFLVMTSRKVDSKFLHYFTLTEEFIKQVDSSTYGSKMPRASWDYIGLLNIPIPSHESEKIAVFLDYKTAKIDTLIEKQQRLIELAQERRTALISAAVTGKIDVRDCKAAAAQEAAGDECLAHLSQLMPKTISYTFSHKFP
ncbi:MAG: restriction endonuclease subunit S [Rhodoferax sp.]|nr:restriction endonuclease subunit S [Rhodoferax sp.]